MKSALILLPFLLWSCTSPTPPACAAWPAVKVFTIPEQVEFETEREDIEKSKPLPTNPVMPAVAADWERMRSELKAHKQ